MHPQAWRWLEAQIRPLLADSARVIAMGGSAIDEATPRQLFRAGSDHLVIGVRSAPGVDLVVDAATWLPPRELRGVFDVALCTEVFQHAPAWRAILYNLWLTLRPGGVLLVTCASHPRPPHSVSGVVPPPPGVWYANLAADDLLTAMRLLLREVESSQHPSGDLYARGWR
jgi:SAM-dependent methyltransferase